MRLAVGNTSVNDDNENRERSGTAICFQLVKNEGRDILDYVFRHIEQRPSVKQKNPLRFSPSKQIRMTYTS